MAGTYGAAGETYGATGGTYAALELGDVEPVVSPSWTYGGDDSPGWTYGGDD